MFNNDRMSKNMVETEEPQVASQCGAYKSYAGQARLHACSCLHMPTRPVARTHIQICNICCLSTSKIIREWTSISLYKYIFCFAYASVNLIKTCARESGPICHSTLRVWEKEIVSRKATFIWGNKLLYGRKNIYIYTYIYIYIYNIYPKILTFAEYCNYWEQQTSLL
jgi:hypothetical protein